MNSLFNDGMEESPRPCSGTEVSNVQRALAPPRWSGSGGICASDVSAAPLITDILPEGQGHRWERSKESLETERIKAA